MDSSLSQYIDSRRNWVLLIDFSFRIFFPWGELKRICLLLFKNDWSLSRTIKHSCGKPFAFCFPLHVAPDHPANGRFSLDAYRRSPHIECHFAFIWNHGVLEWANSKQVYRWRPDTARRCSYLRYLCKVWHDEVWLWLVWGASGESHAQLCVGGDDGATHLPGGVLLGLSSLTTVGYLWVKTWSPFYWTTSAVFFDVRFLPICVVLEDTFRKHIGYDSL